MAHGSLFDGIGCFSLGLRRAGLESNCRTRNTDPYPERTRRKISRAIRSRIRSDGLEEAMPFLRKNADERRQAVRMGWPMAGTLLEARILEALAGAPLTAAAVTEQVGNGRPWIAAVVRDLKRRGLLVVQSRAKKYCVYALAAGVRRTFAGRGTPDGPRSVRGPRTKEGQDR
jgi:hypothetical protein